MGLTSGLGVTWGEVSMEKGRFDKQIVILLLSQLHAMLFSSSCFIFYDKGQMVEKFELLLPMRKHKSYQITCLTNAGYIQMDQAIRQKEVISQYIDRTKRVGISNLRLRAPSQFLVNAEYSPTYEGSNKFLLSHPKIILKNRNFLTSTL